jgi:hypothetical protein
MELVRTHQAERLEAPISLDDLTGRVRVHAEGCCDHRSIPLGATWMETDGTWYYNGAAGYLTAHAFRQLCGRIGLGGGGTLPAAYLGRCPAALTADNINHWLAQPECDTRRVLVRTFGREKAHTLTVRAVLSDRYAPVDHLPLLELLQTLVPRSGLVVQGWSLDDELLTVRLLLNEDHPASIEDPLRIGLHIQNSEIGLGRVAIHGLVTRLVCTNGLVVKVADLSGVERRHIGRAGEDLQALVCRGLTLVLAEADAAAWRLARLRQEPAPQPVEAFLQRTAREVELPENLVASAVAGLEGETRYDVVNALTRVVQHLPVLDRVRIETLMSRFLHASGNGD